MALQAVTLDETYSLDDKYARASGRIYLTGIQALVRLPIMQRQRDAAAGLDTGCFISGYRGSPLGTFDQALWSARRFLVRNAIHFQPGLNEDLAATAVWGSQQARLWPGARHDGVFAMWYGKGPGVDRSGDVFRHANYAGTDPNGGVLALAGDDHACKSSTVPSQSEHNFVSVMIPVLHPANVQEVLDYGLIGWAMSRYSGLWTGFKAIAETMDSSASVEVDPHRVEIVMPEDFEMPPGGLGIRWPDPPLVQEERLMRHKLYAALAFARANRLDRLVFDSGSHRFGIVTTGKSYLDVRQALDDLGIDERLAAELGICIYKVGMPWPLEPQGVRRFAEGLDELIVVEEKRAIIENQLKEQLYNWHADKRPVVVGKFDEERRWILPSTGELSPAQIAVAIGRRLLKRIDHPGIAERVAFLEAKEAEKVTSKPPIERIPYFCSGCPHNTSTRVPEGSRALAGIGCHYMANWMPDRKTETFSQMGGEGVAAIGAAPFRETEHVFVNLGDGTYFHSGSLAVRAAIAAGINATYKILFNDAVAMTGGQPVDGTLTVPMVAAQMAAEGVKRIVVMSDEPEKYAEPGTPCPFLPHGTEVAHRRDLDRVQRELAAVEGVTILIYDQTCAAEKRRRRKRGTFPDPARRVVINEAVCEGCGDCSRVSNCLSVVPVETEYGTKRQIDQSSCNKDFSCVEGFCPSFVSVLGGQLKKPRPAAAKGAEGVFEVLPEPALPALDRPYGIMVTGIGGTGVVTIGALLGMASHLEGKGVAVLDQAGLAQKGGAVVTHVKIAATPSDIHAIRIAAGGSDLVLGCDLVVTAAAETCSKMNPSHTRIVLNTHETITGDFTQNPDFRIPGRSLLSRIVEEVGDASLVLPVDATELATALLGDSIATNLFVLGFAWQKGLIPVSAAAIERAIELNGTAVGMNKSAFLWGRRAAHDLQAVVRAASRSSTAEQDGDRHLSQSLDETIERRVAYLTDYQDAAWADRYRRTVERVREREAPLGRTELTEAVAKGLFKLMSYKDEYEVARLYTDGRFLKSIEERFEGDWTLSFHLAPPLLAERDPATGHLRKRAYGPWVYRAFGLIARMKRLRGTAFDLFGRTAERRMERGLIDEYLATIDTLLRHLDAERHGLAVEIARMPERMRGFGHVKEFNVAKARAATAELVARLSAPAASAAPREAAE